MLLAELLSAMLGLVTTDEVRHVSEVGDDTYDGEEDTPYRTIDKALSTAATLPAGQRLVIRLSGSTPFREPLVVPSNVTIEGPARIEGVGGTRPVTIAGMTTARVSGVVLRDLELVGSGTFITLGATVFVSDADDVRLERCVVRGGLGGRGGGVAVLDSTAVVLDGCRIKENTAGTVASALTGASVAHPYDMVLPAGDGHGGGVYLRDSAVTLVGCDITENRAIQFGGGVGIRNTLSGTTVPSHPVEIRDCELTFNQVSHGDLVALPPSTRLYAPATMGDPVLDAFRSDNPLISDTDEETAVANLHGGNFESGLGGAIAVRNADQATRITGNLIGVTRAGTPAPNLARRGGGIHLYFGASPRIEGNTIANNLVHGDGGGIGIDLFDPIFPAGETDAFGIVAVPMIPRAPINLTGNTFRDNHAVEDGGSLYSTGAARLIIKGGTVSGNGAGECGGGFRVTYATQLYVEAVAFTGNRANLIAGGPDGGGAVAARNANVHLQACTFTANSVSGFAGGAVFFTSMFEGGFGRFGFVKDKRDRFDKIMEGSFGFHTRVLRIVECTGAGNEAKLGSGAGGFVYAVRTPDKGGIEPMWIQIAGGATALGVNTSDHPTRKRGNVVIELSGKEFSPGVPEDRVAVGREVPAAGIPASTPTPDEQALLVLRDATVAHDDPHPVYAGGGYVHGPRPTLTAVSFGVVPAAGGAAITLTGTGFETGSRVQIGAHDATILGTITATAIAITTPAGPPGLADVVVTGPSGAQGWIDDALQLVRPPKLTYMSKLTGHAGDVITFRGAGLPIGTLVHFVFPGGDVEADVAPQTVDDQLLVTVPPPPAVGGGTALVRVTSPTGEEFTRPDTKAFVYLP